MVAEAGFEPRDLRVMSPMSYQTAPLRVNDLPMYCIKNYRLCQLIFINLSIIFIFFGFNLLAPPIGVALFCFLCYNLRMIELDLSKIQRGDVVAVALSGGKDSVCLLHALNAVKADKGFSLAAVNVEHGIRGEESISDTEFCRALAEKLSIPFRTYSVNALAFAKENGLSVEESARILRYEKFSQALSDGFCTKIAVAHHLSDSVETILFNLFRGASLSGAKGIADTREDGRIIRPLVGVSAEEIALYVHKHRLSYVSDSTNSDCDYTRNSIRLNILPQIKKVFPKVELSLSRFAAIAKSDDEYLYSLAAKALDFEFDRYRFSVSLPDPVFSRCVILAMKALGIEKDYEKVHVDAVLSLKNCISGKSITLPKNVCAVREHDDIFIFLMKSERQDPVPFTLGETVFGEYVITAEKLSLPPENFIDGLYFDGDKLPIGALIRTKETGDEFVKCGGGKVSLKKYLTDCKFPQSKKNVTPIVAFGKTVYCVCEKDISSLIKIDKTTKNIIKLTCIKRRR